MGLGDLARQSHEHREREFRGGDRIAAGGVHHDDSALGSGIDINVVHANAGPAHHAQLRRCFHHFPSHLGFRTHHHGFRFANNGQQFGFGEPLLQHGHPKSGLLPEVVNALW